MVIIFLVHNITRLHKYRLKYELNIAEQTGRKGNLLEKLNQMLLTVSPTCRRGMFFFHHVPIYATNFDTLSDKIKRYY